jgi:N-succinyldiaminopimelate aminotransferase
MTAPSGLHALAQGVILSPFTRIRRLLDGIDPGHARPIELMVGEPREVMPGFVPDRMVEAKETLAKYPPIRTSEELRKTIGAWIERRYGIAGSIDALRHVHPLNGSREGLFFAILPAVGRKVVDGRPVVLLPNPMYHAYLGATYAANCEPVLLDATAATGFLPDLDVL